ncbi:MAG: YgaP-like transmembrane domain [Acidobacteriota bacterium]
MIRHNFTRPNVGRVERGASVMIGSLLVYHGLRKSWTGAALAFLGLGFLRRGITGFCHTYQTFGLRTAENEGHNVSVPYELGIRVDEKIVVHRPRAEVYKFWRNLPNLAAFMEHIESIEPVGGDMRSHWVAKGPAGSSVEWDAEIINDIENELLAWRSLDGSDVASAGSVHFRDRPGGGTEVSVELQYNPPAGIVGAFVAKVFGAEPSAQIRNDLKRLKTRLEADLVSSRS